MATTNISLVTAGALGFSKERSDGTAQMNAVCGVAIASGQAIVLDSSTAKWALADADTQSTRDQVFIALESGVVGQGIDGSKHCVVTGFDLYGLNYGGAIYLSDTAGAWSSATPGGNAFVCGRIEPVGNNGVGVARDMGIRFCML